MKDFLRSGTENPFSTASTLRVISGGQFAVSHNAASPSHRCGRVSSRLGAINDATGVHHASRRRGSWLAARGTRPTVRKSNSNWVCDLSYVEAFQSGLADNGLVEGRNITVDMIWVTNSFGQAAMSAKWWRAYRGHRSQSVQNLADDKHRLDHRHRYYDLRRPCLPSRLSGQFSASDRFGALE